MARLRENILDKIGAHSIFTWTILLFDPFCAQLKSTVLKEDIREQPTSRNLSDTATRVLQCTWPFATSRKDCSAIDT